MENNEESKNMEMKKKKVPLLFIVFGVVLIILSFIFVTILGKNLGNTKDNESKNENEKNTDNIETEKVDDKQENENKDDNDQKDSSNELVELTDSSVKDNLDKFILAASDWGVYPILLGQDGLTERQKMLIAYNSVVYINNKTTELTNDTVPQKYKGDSYWNMDYHKMYELKIEDYKNTYFDFFHENIDIKKLRETDLRCPFVYVVEEDLGNIYLSDQCGDFFDTSDTLLKTYKYVQDDNYYYVYQYIGIYNGETKEYEKYGGSYEVVDVPSFEGYEDKFDTLVWKFDKNCLFVSTELMK